MDILAAYREVGSYRGAAEICGTTHKTVRRVVERHNAGGAAPQRKDRGHNYDEVRDAGHRAGARVRKGRISAKRLLPAARTAGYAGSARNFRRLVAEVKAAWRAGHHRGRRPAVWTPGDTLVIDWGCSGRAARVLRGAGLVAVAVRAVRRRREGRHHAGRCWPSASRCSAGCRRRCWPTGWAA